MKPTLLVLAAGMGSRYGGLKQIDPIGPHGEAILDYSVYDAIRAGFGKLVFVIRHDIDQPFREKIGNKFKAHIPVEYVYQGLDALPTGFTVPPQRQKPWGTGQATLMAQNVIQEPFVVINADDFYGADSFKISKNFLATSKQDYALLGFTLRNTLSDYGTVSRGVCSLDSNQYMQTVTEIIGIKKIGRQKAQYLDEQGHPQQLSGDEIVSMNMWGFHPVIFSQLEQQFIEFLAQHGTPPTKEEFYIPSAINILINQGQAKVKVLTTPSSWFGMTYQQDKPHVVESIQQLINSNVYPNNLF
ncbi:sugar phosphate nucleotidyltransferase [Anaerolineales bacterium HSG24]|nr:sugar phosphate nucleotidyltransferase [Anaerolineales bacterium HSG24]